MLLLLAKVIIIIMLCHYVSVAVLIACIPAVSICLCDAAISYCFEKEAIFTQETVALVVQQLVERQPLPTLFMRTVIQSLNIYPRMMAFSMGILERLVKKQVRAAGYSILMFGDLCLAIL